MNRFVSSFTLALTLICPLLGLAQSNLESDPAYLPIDKVIDLKTIRPEVNINLPRFLLKDAATDLSEGTNAPLANTGIDLADLIKDVKSIRVVVIEANQTNRAALDAGVKKLRADLESKWTPVVSVPEDNVGVYAMGDPSGESMAGLAVLIYDDGDAVIANIVGRVSIGKLVKLASRMDKMPKDLLKKLQGIGNQPGKEPASGGDTSDSKDKKKPESKERAPEDPTAK
jgi:hypothetical protein